MPAQKKVLLLTIGNEVTSGHTLNGNAAWIARTIEGVGLTPDRVVTIRDDFATMVKEIRAATKKYRVVIITGGLGPTHDDITKPALVKVFNAPLVRHEPSLRAVRKFFTKIDKPMPDINLGQADMPDGFTPLPNRWGTAPGLYHQVGDCHLFALPGVPGEMKKLMRHSVMPVLRSKVADTVIARKILRTAGVGESSLYGLVEPTGALNEAEVAFLPNMGRCDIRISISDTDGKQARTRLNKVARKIKKAVADCCYGTDEKTLAAAVGELLVKNKKTLAAAESCTGGRFAAAITAVPGSSGYFCEGLVTYSDDAKMRRLKVKRSTLKKHGAVSAAVAEEMALGVCATSGADIGLSATGIAGPTGGTNEKPVGLVYIGLCFNGMAEVRELRLKFDRNSNQERTTHEMMAWLWRVLKEL